MRLIVCGDRTLSRDEELKETLPLTIPSAAMAYTTSLDRTN
jgi:hypothetical protein